MQVLLNKQGCLNYMVCTYVMLYVFYAYYAILRQPDSSSQVLRCLAKINKENAVKIALPTFLFFPILAEYQFIRYCNIVRRQQARLVYMSKIPPKLAKIKNMNI